jgi:Flp pilus assembly protein TadG
VSPVGERIRRRTERGSMAVEIVILAPVMLAFLMLLVAAGRLVAVKGDLEAAARDAARGASLERDVGTAGAQARSIVSASLDKQSIACRPADLGGSNFVAGGFVRVTLDCRVSYDGLGLIGLPGSVAVTADSAAPIDTYRRTGPVR